MAASGGVGVDSVDGVDLVDGVELMDLTGSGSGRFGDVSWVQSSFSG
jgi:hypothetical protein